MNIDSIYLPTALVQHGHYTRLQYKTCTDQATSRSTESALYCIKTSRTLPAQIFIALGYTTSRNKVTVPTKCVVYNAQDSFLRNK